MDEKELDSISSDISVVDVYDLASDIGKQCEKIIDCYGAEAVTALMPKVVHALELLEALASRNENENTAMQVLSDRVASLESEKIERAVYREKLQRVSKATNAIHLISMECKAEAQSFIKLLHHE